MLHHVALVRTDVSEELSASFIRMTRIGKLGTMIVTANVPCSPILVTLMNEALSSSETSVLTRATQRNIPEDAILQWWICLASFNRTGHMDKKKTWRKKQVQRDSIQGLFLVEYCNIIC
jgi:hypothetical protein